MSHARETTLTFFLMSLPPLKPKSCAGHNFHNSDTFRHILITFGRNEEEACPMQERQLSRSSLCSYLP